LTPPPAQPAPARELRRANRARFEAVWARTHPGPDAVAAGPLFDEIAAHYREPFRTYHTLGHVDDCLARLDTVAHLVATPDAIEVALWFHDVLCDPGARDNEVRSARWYLERSAGTTARFRIAVCRMILASRHLQPAVRADARYMVDIDLAGFGSPWLEFRRTTDLVRGEFPHKSDEDFARGLAPFLRSLVARESMYGTDFFRERCEATARRNVEQLIVEWRDAGFLAAR
jgi:predicted metal-dependent HD superfamily phosphohydrolase